MPRRYALNDNNISDLTIFIKTKNHSSSTWKPDEELSLISLYYDGKSFKEIAAILTKPIDITSRHFFYLISHFNKTSEEEHQIHQKKADISDFSCRYYHDCSTCPFPACTEDGYRPHFNIYNRRNKWTYGPWEKDEIDTLLRLETIYSDEILSNILNRTLEDIKMKKSEYKYYGKRCG